MPLLGTAGYCWVLVGPCWVLLGPWCVLVGPWWVLGGSLVGPGGSLVGPAGSCWVLGGSLVGHCLSNNDQNQIKIQDFISISMDKAIKKTPCIWGLSLSVTR